MRVSETRASRASSRSLVILHLLLHECNFFFSLLEICASDAKRTSKLRVSQTLLDIYINIYLYLTHERRYERINMRDGSL